MMMIIFILTALYIGDDVRIVYALAIYDAIFFGDGRRDWGTNKAILGVGYMALGPLYLIVEPLPLSVLAGRKLNNASPATLLPFGSRSNCSCPSLSFQSMMFMFISDCFRLDVKGAHYNFYQNQRCPWRHLQCLLTKIPTLLLIL